MARPMVVPRRPALSEPRSGESKGFTLVEVLVAMALLATAVVTTAGLLTIASNSVRAARVQSWASLLAIDKLEELRASPWPDLAVSTGDTLGHDAPGFVDYLNWRGEPVGAAAAVFVRRWNIQPLPSDSANTYVLQVYVRPGFARLATLRTKEVG
jgi:prepilin-type N-terminal cleavage/methylation domain-containing protein